MPVYDYKCNTCGSVIEFQRNIGEDREPSCCQTIMQRLWSAPEIIFNAPGFYKTENRIK